MIRVCYGTSMVGKAGLGLAGPGLDVAMDQLPSPWPLGAPAGKDICQRESWQLYFLLNLGLFLSHSFMSFPFFFLLLMISSLLFKIFELRQCIAHHPVFLKAFSVYSFVPTSHLFSVLPDSQVSQ